MEQTTELRVGLSQSHTFWLAVQYPGCLIANDRKQYLVLFMSSLEDLLITINTVRLYVRRIRGR